MKNQLKKYLDDPTGFMDGFSLFVSLGGGPELSRLKEISQKSFVSNTNKEYLYKALWKIYHRLPEVEDIPVLKSYHQRNADPVEPLIIQELRVEGKKWKKREAYTHALLVNEAEGDQDQERLFQLAKELMEEIQPELNRIYGQIKAYEKKGILPPDQVQQIQQQAIQLYKKMENMKTRIYRLKSWLEKKDLSEEKEAKYRAEVKEKEQEIESIKKSLKL